MNKEVSCPQLDECGAGKFADGRLVGAGKGLGLSEGLLCRLGRGAMGGAEVFGEWRHSATGSLYDSLVARYRTWSMRAEKVPRPGRIEAAEHPLPSIRKHLSMPSSRSAARLSVTFDDDHSVADAGLALVAVLSEKLGLEELAEHHSALLVDTICHR